MSQAKSGNIVNVHYVGTLNDGTEFDSSRQRGEALSFTLGSGQLITGFDQAVAGMTVGETKSITLPPTEAYGELRDNLTQTVPQAAFPEDFQFIEGNQVMGQSPQGMPVMATIVTTHEDGTVTLDMNHPMAGKTLNFNIELLSVEEAAEAAEEVAEEE